MKRALFQKLADKFAQELDCERAIFVAQSDGCEVYYFQCKPEKAHLIAGGCELKVTDGNTFLNLPAEYDEWIEPYLKKALKGTGIRGL